MSIETLEKSVTEHHEKTREQLTEIRTRLLEIEQKGAFKPGAGGGGASELADLIAGSEGIKLFLAGNTPTVSIQVPMRLLTKNTIINQTGQNQTLVAADRRPDIAFAPPQRLTIRGLFSAMPTNSNLIEVASESTFTNSAGVQGGDASPTGSGEGSLKNESSMTFTLANIAVVTIAHFIAASRQILSDAPRLQGHIETRLLHGLALEEELEFLTGTGAAGEVNGINNQATAYNQGATADTRIDTLAKAASQLALSNFEPSGFILHPTDWLNVKLLKDTQGRYLLGNPQDMGMPQLWGLAVIPTASQTLGRFTVLDPQRAGYIMDRESATVRVSENVADAFLRNLVHLLAEERTVLVIEQPTAIVTGTF